MAGTRSPISSPVSSSPTMTMTPPATPPSFRKPHHLQGHSQTSHHHAQHQSGKDVNRRISAPSLSASARLSYYPHSITSSSNVPSRVPPVIYTTTMRNESSSASKARLSIPTEIWQNIIAQVTNPSELYPFLLVSHTWYSIAVRHLYKQVTFTSIRQRNRFAAILCGVRNAELAVEMRWVNNGVMAGAPMARGGSATSLDTTVNDSEDDIFDDEQDLIDLSQVSSPVALAAEFNLIPSVTAMPAFTQPIKTPQSRRSSMTSTRKHSISSSYSSTASFNLEPSLAQNNSTHLSDNFLLIRGIDFGFRTSPAGPIPSLTPNPTPNSSQTTTPSGSAPNSPSLGALALPNSVAIAAGLLRSSTQSVAAGSAPAEAYGLWDQRYISPLLYMVSTRCTNLSYLGLSGAQFADTMFAEAIDRLPYLTHLDLSFSCIKNEGLHAIASSRNTTQNLQHLDVSGVFRFRRIRTTVITEITQNCTSLRTLVVNQCPDLTSCVDGWRQQRPDLQIAAQQLAVPFHMVGSTD
ncbi:hypothetical protein DFS34DRAFT_235085 [Phlyctochytrium arcticum]|nr:hypothetical protein DFS34DRAFT_235085 [Phlyctochytrium arcticum]